ncbi:hypothetical protein PIB30_034234 [Stylosanthes scabra]|uniref:Uncharacterized protein n=1 Tax=Stylosanthes scabra TaxID=79078 RepID=A0ABU6UER3_9FABA|nr:hypothetical protein [Stylosanthes scabra]
MKHRSGLAGPPPRRSLEIRATLKILVEAEVFILCPSTLILEELICEVLGRPNSSTSAPEQLAPTEPIMSNGNTPTPQEMAELFNAMKEELQQLKKERAKWNKREEGKHNKETEHDDEDIITSGALKTR